MQPRNPHRVVALLAQGPQGTPPGLKAPGLKAPGLKAPPATATRHAYDPIVRGQCQSHSECQWAMVRLELDRVETWALRDSVLKELGTPEQVAGTQLLGLSTADLEAMRAIPKDQFAATLQERHRDISQGQSAAGMEFDRLTALEREKKGVISDAPELLGCGYMGEYYTHAGNLNRYTRGAMEDVRDNVKRDRQWVFRVLKEKKINAATDRLLRLSLERSEKYLRNIGIRIADLRYREERERERYFNRVLKEAPCEVEKREQKRARVEGV